LFVILLVYTEWLFLSVYLWTNFTIRFISLTFLTFLFLFFSTVIPLIYIDRCFPWYLPIDITMENFVTKIHYNIPTEKFWICKTRGLDLDSTGF
jgi:hypothetical protein